MGLEWGMKEGKRNRRMSEIMCPKLGHVIHSVLRACGSKHTSRSKLLL